MKKNPANLTPALSRGRACEEIGYRPTLLLPAQAEMQKQPPNLLQKLDCRDSLRCKAR